MKVSEISFRLLHKRYLSTFNSRSYAFSQFVCFLCPVFSFFFPLLLSMQSNFLSASFDFQCSLPILSISALFSLFSFLLFSSSTRNAKKRRLDVFNGVNRKVFCLFELSQSVLISLIKILSLFQVPWDEKDRKYSFSLSWLVFLLLFFTVSDVYLHVIPCTKNEIPENGRIYEK